MKERIANAARRAGAKVAAEIKEINGFEDQDIVFTAETLDKKKVIKLSGSKNCCFTFPSHEDLQYRLTKLFIKDLKHCIINIGHHAITQHLEVEHCDHITINVQAPCETLQIDLSKQVKIHFEKDRMDADTKVIHAAVEGLRITTHEGHEHNTDYKEHPPVRDPEDNERFLPSDELQFLSILEEGEIITVRVERKDGHLIPDRVDKPERVDNKDTDDEPEEEQEEVQEADNENGNENNDESPQDDSSPDSKRKSSGPRFHVF